MKGTLTNVLIFVAGAAIGSIATWKIVKTKYEQIAQEEIDSVKEAYSKRCDILLEELHNEEVTEIEKSEEDEEFDEYADIISNCGYIETCEEGGTTPVKVKKPYVISPEEFGEIDEYDTTSLTYYADGVLTDERDIPIQDVESIVGKDSLTHFGEYEDDSVFVRNERLRTDYEILSDSRKYSYIANRKPHQVD